MKGIFLIFILLIIIGCGVQTPPPTVGGTSGKINVYTITDDTYIINTKYNWTVGNIYREVYMDHMDKAVSAYRANSISITDDANRPTVFQLNTPGTIGSDSYIIGAGPGDSNGGWTNNSQLKLLQVEAKFTAGSANTRIMIGGITTSINLNLLSKKTGVFFLYNTTLNKWTSMTCILNSCTVGNVTVSLNTAWHVFSIYSTNPYTTGGCFKFYIDSTLLGTHCDNLPYGPTEYSSLVGIWTEQSGASSVASYIDWMRIELQHIVNNESAPNNVNSTFNITNFFATKSYVNSQDVYYNNSQKIWIVNNYYNKQQINNLLANGTSSNVTKNYVDLQDIYYNNSQKIWIENSYYNITQSDSNYIYTNGSNIALVGKVFSHKDTSNVQNSTNINNIVIQNLYFDNDGHVVGYTNKTISSGGVSQAYVDQQDAYYYSLTTNYTNQQISILNSTLLNLINNITIAKGGNDTIWHNDECTDSICWTYLQVSER
jgi:hypothetical protein